MPVTTKPRVSWITPDYFLNVDAKVVPALQKDYDFDWLLIRTPNSHRTIDCLLDGRGPHEYVLKHRQRDPRVVMEYASLLSSIRRRGYDMVYTSFHGLPYFLPLAAGLLDRNKVVYGVHNVHTPEGATHETWMRLYHQFAFKAFKRFHVFSTHQLEVISRLLPGKDHYYAPLLPDNYGPSSVSAPLDRVRFLSFGYVRRYKRLDLLIRAFQSLCEAGYRNIELVIAGRCDDWKPYEELIGDTPHVTVRIGVVPNREIADLVSSCHYVVMPYQDSAQSAVVTLAYNYRRPVIVSDIDAFAGVVRPGQTGLVFPNLSSDGLANAMEQAIQGHPHTFNEFTAKVESFMRREYATEGVVAQYEAFMDETIASAATA